MNKSNIQVEACRVAPAVKLTEGRTVQVEMTASGHLQVHPIVGFPDERNTFSRVECKTLAKVLASFAKRGDLSEFK